MEEKRHRAIDGTAAPKPPSGTNQPRVCRATSFQGTIRSGTSPVGLDDSDHVRATCAIARAPSRLTPAGTTVHGRIESTDEKLSTGRAVHALENYLYVEDDRLVQQVVQAHDLAVDA